MELPRAYAPEPTVRSVVDGEEDDDFLDENSIVDHEEIPEERSKMLLNI